jgi:hypothetical protein
VLAATQRGHDHDIADYEIYLWEVGTPADTAVRLTYHSGNDRWPDIFRAGAVTASEPATKPAADGGEPAKAEAADEAGAGTKKKHGGKKKR